MIIKSFYDKYGNRQIDDRNRRPKHKRHITQFCVAKQTYKC